MAAVYKMDSAGFYSGRIEGQARWMYCAARFAGRLQAITGLTARARATSPDEPWRQSKKVASFENRVSHPPKVRCVSQVFKLFFVFLKQTTGRRHRTEFFCFHLPQRLGLNPGPTGPRALTNNNYTISSNQPAGNVLRSNSSACVRTSG